MKALHIHLVFGALALACGAVLIASAIERGNAADYNAALAAPDTARHAAMPEAAVARGALLAAKGETQPAQQAFQQALQHGSSAVQRIARYDLANLHLRQAIALGKDNAQALPLLELSKQYYREVLAENPGDWDARYNLERALWLLPESLTWYGSSDKAEARERRVTASRIEPGELP
jgi:mxaK protein